MIKTGLNSLDDCLGGGITEGLITDLYGPNGVGKTQLTLQIALNSLNQGGTVFFQDTMGNFRPERMLEMINQRNLSPNLLDNVIVSRITNSYEQIQNLTRIPEISSLSLIIVDNVTDLFSFEFSKKNQELEKRFSFMNYLRNLSLIGNKEKIPILLTNIIRKIDDKEKENFENTIDLFTHYKIKLEKKGPKFLGTVNPPFSASNQFSYIITKRGLEDTS